MRNFDLSVVLVHYRTPDLLRRAIAAVEDDLRSSELKGEIVVVDNSDDLSQDDLAACGAPRVLSPGENLGYAGAAQLAVSSTQASVIVLMNCDVLVQAGCLGRLCEELREGASVAGPSLFWDEEQRIFLPPSEPRGRFPELAVALTSRFPFFAASLRRARRRHSQRHWCASVPLRSTNLSGCLLACRRDAWLDTGGMDSDYQLYFEETDWLLRLGKAGHSVSYVPGARAVHLYDRSASGEPAADRWYQESAKRFRIRHYGGAFTRLLELTARVGGHAGGDLVPVQDPPKMTVPPQARGGWAEIGAAPFGCPAAAQRLPPDSEFWEIPEEIWNGLRPGCYVLVIVDRRGREHGLRFVTKARP